MKSMERNTRILEIIEIRSVHEKNLFKEISLADYIQSVETGVKLKEIKLYKHKHIDTDLCIHLYYESDPDSNKQDFLGLHLSSLLKEWGLINHSIWIEEENIIFESHYQRRKKHE